jgi:hypothetical protein
VQVVINKQPQCFLLSSELPPLHKHLQGGVGVLLVPLVSSSMSPLAAHSMYGSMQSIHSTLVQQRNLMKQLDRILCHPKKTLPNNKNYVAGANFSSPNVDVFRCWRGGGAEGT